MKCLTALLGYLSVRQFFKAVFNPTLLSAYGTHYSTSTVKLMFLSQSEKFCQCSTSTVMDHTHILSRKFMG